MKQPSLILCGAILLVSYNSQAQQSGEKLFKTFCNVCHTINKGKLIGPDLADVHKRHSEDWLLEFIKASQAMVQKGDKDAVALFQQFNQSVMPNAPYTETEIKSILAYIYTQSPSYVAKVEPTDQTKDTVTVQAPPVRSVIEAIDDEIKMGNMLFSGEVRLAGRGPACISCHHLRNDKLIGGGLLAKDLTDAFTRLNEAGVRAIVSSPPFPAMKEAYANAVITEEEAYNLTAFLKYADDHQYGQQARDYQQYLLIAGAIGLGTLFLVFSIYWGNRRKEAVNQKIFNRQIKTSSLYS
jgi:cytochrome c2